jgi:hypothetical protein
MMGAISFKSNFRKNKKAVSPAVSTIILTCAIVVILVVAVLFANNLLSGQIAKNEFNSMSQLMQTTGQEVDQVAWIPGRTQALTYTTKYGQVLLRSMALNYSFSFNGSPVWTNTSSIIMFAMPIANYGIANNYSQEIYPSSTSFLQNGTSAPVCRIFSVEQMPMPDGSFIRTVVAPTIRELNAVINGINYVRFYVPILNNGLNLQPSQSVTLAGINVFYLTASNINNVTISVSFPSSATLGLTSAFFGFASTSQTLTIASNSIVEIYGGNVTVSLGISS